MDHPTANYFDVGLEHESLASLRSLPVDFVRTIYRPLVLLIDTFGLDKLTVLTIHVVLLQLLHIPPHNLLHDPFVDSFVFDHQVVHPHRDRWWSQLSYTVVSMQTDDEMHLQWTTKRTMTTSIDSVLAVVVDELRS